MKPNKLLIQFIIAPFVLIFYIFSMLVVMVFTLLFQIPSLHFGLGNPDCVDNDELWYDKYNRAYWKLFKVDTDI